MKLKTLPRIGRRDESMFIVDEENRIVAVVPPTAPAGVARMFEAMPDLLAACEMALPLLTEGEDGKVGFTIGELREACERCDQVADVIRAAIAKARDSAT